MTRRRRNHVRFLPWAALLLVPAFAAAAAGDGTIDTVAGTGRAEDNGAAGAALETNIGDPFGVEVGPDGALYVTEVRNHRVRRVDLKTGALTTVAGNGRKGYAGDGGPATEARLDEPYEVRFDRAGNMLVVEMQNHLVRRVDAKTGVISTVAGTGEAGFAGDGGPAVRAQFRSPHSIALDADDNVYVADIGNHRVRRIDARTGRIDTIAGNGGQRPPVDGGRAAGQPLPGPRALDVEGTDLWIALREGHSVWKLDLAGGGVLAHVAGTGERGFGGDGGPAESATFDGPKGIAVGGDGDGDGDGAGLCVYVADTENHAVRRIDLRSGVITTIAGAPPKRNGGGGDGGPAARGRLDRPHGVCVGPDGAVYVGDTLNHRVRRVRMGGRGEQP